MAPGAACHRCRVHHYCRHNGPSTLPRPAARSPLTCAHTGAERDDRRTPARPVPHPQPVLVRLLVQLLLRRLPRRSLYVLVRHPDVHRRRASPRSLSPALQHANIAASAGVHVPNAEGDLAVARPPAQLATRGLARHNVAHALLLPLCAPPRLPPLQY